MTNQYKFLFFGIGMLLIPNVSFPQCVATTDCATLGYTKNSCPDGKGIKCPFGNKWACMETCSSKCTIKKREVLEECQPMRYVNASGYIVECRRCSYICSGIDEKCYERSCTDKGGSGSFGSINYGALEQAVAALPGYEGRIQSDDCVN